MIVAWMIFYFKTDEFNEHVTYDADKHHSINSLEPWDDHEYDTEEEALSIIAQALLDKDDKLVILKVYR